MLFSVIPQETTRWQHLFYCRNKNFKLFSDYDHIPHLNTKEYFLTNQIMKEFTFDLLFGKHH